MKCSDSDYLLLEQHHPVGCGLYESDIFLSHFQPFSVHEITNTTYALNFY